MTDTPQNVAEGIYDRWLQSNSQTVEPVQESNNYCSGCPVRDSRGCRSPFFGHGSRNGPVDVMLVGEAPGPASVENNDRPQSQWDTIRSEKEWYDRIYAAFESDEDDQESNSPYLEQFTDNLQNNESIEGVYFTNLLKCNKIDSDITTAWVPSDIEIDASQSDTDLDIQANYSIDKLNEVGKATCVNYLMEELVAMEPEVLVPFGGSGMVKEVYNIFDIDIPTISSSINNRECIPASAKISGTEIQTTIVPTYHFSAQSINQNLTNIDSVPDEIDPEKQRDIYWETVIDIIESALTDEGRSNVV